MRRRDVPAYAGDIGDAYLPVDPEVPLPLHMVGLARLGLPLVDGAEVEELAEVCVELERTASCSSSRYPGCAVQLVYLSTSKRSCRTNAPTAR